MKIIWAFIMAALLSESAILAAELPDSIDCGGALLGGELQGPNLGELFKISVDQMVGEDSNASTWLEDFRNRLSHEINRGNERYLQLDRLFWRRRDELTDEQITEYRDLGAGFDRRNQVFLDAYQRRVIAQWEAVLRPDFDQLHTILEQRKLWESTLLGQKAPDHVDELVFGARRFRIRAYLGSGKEGSAYWVGEGGKDFVIKVFRHAHHSPDYDQEAFKLLSSLNAPTAKFLTRFYDPVNALMVSFEKGWTPGMIAVLLAQKTITTRQNMAFEFFSAKNGLALKERYEDRLKGLLPYGFNPGGDNLLFDPWQNRWIIIDPM